MKIHKKFKEYYKYSERNKSCKFECDKKGCQWVSCGTSDFCIKYGIIPCRCCGFWSGYGMTQDDIIRYNFQLGFLVEELKRR